MVKGRTGSVAGYGFRLHRRWHLGGRGSGIIHYSRAAGRYYRRKKL